MLKNYFTIAFRNITRNKSYSFINIFGLSVGVACCLLLMLFIQDELSIDRQHTHIDNLYRIVTHLKRETHAETVAACSPPVAMAMKAEIPEIEKSLRLVTPPDVTHFLIRNDIETFYETGGYAADSTLFDVFTFGFVEGSPAKALYYPNSVVITETLKRKLFRDKSALNQTISITQGGAPADYTITGVIQDIKRSHIHANFFFSISSPGGVAEFVRNSNEWAGQNFVPSYVLIHQGSQVGEVERKMNEVLMKHGSDAIRAFGASKSLSLEPVKDIHLKSVADKSPRITYVYVIACLAIFILLIACINFINLATAKAVKRANEIGVRKVMGAFRSSLVGQLLGEAMVIVAISIVVSVLIVMASLHSFNALTGKDISLYNMNSLSFLMLLIVLSVITGLLAGGYPAFYMSSFQPAQVLKGKFRPGRSSGTLRKSLVIFQFMVAIIMGCLMFIISKQLRFVREMDLGFDTEAMVVLPLRTEQDKKSYNALRDQLLQESAVQKVSGADYLPGHYWNDIVLYPQGAAKEQGIGHSMNDVDYNFTDVLNIRLLAGRAFTDNLEAEQNKIIINEASAKAFGFTPTEAIGQKLGQTIFIDASGALIQYEVIGVMANFHRQSLHEAITPTFLKARTAAEWDTFDHLVIKTAGADLNGAITHAENVWKNTVSSPFEFSFLDQNLARFYTEDQKAFRVITVFTVLAFVICCLGLYSLSSFIAERRFKEFGIRKVMGASIDQIVGLISKEFVKLVLIAVVLAIPIAWYLMHEWLQRFAYKTQVDVSVFLYAGAIAMLIALMTVSFESLKAAMQNPVKSLRSE